ncbi:MAG: hypothetical protein IT206_07930 [Fimbriimonadaceae bacterium]|nr:hypothetical protein [Fimbriimonadaceae bacterium]
MFCRLLQVTLALLLVLIGAISRSQDMRPGVSIVIKQDSGSELVNISMLNAKYPPELLQEQISSIGKEVGVAPRGIMIFAQAYGEGQYQRLVKAQFAINGLMNRIRGETNLQALARAFAGAPEPFTIHAIQVILDGELPQERTLRTFANEGTVVSGTANSNPNTIEYLIQLKTQDRSSIHIPLSHIKEAKPEPVARAQTGIPANVLILLIVFASIAAGALVYFLMVGRTPNQ